MKYFLALAIVFSLMICQAQEQLEWARWTKHSKPVYESPDSTFAASDPSVLHEGDTYYLYYTDVDNQMGATIISLATSKDGLTWSYQKRLLEVEMRKRAAILAQQLASIGKESLLINEDLSRYDSHIHLF